MFQDDETSPLMEGENTGSILETSVEPLTEKSQRLKNFSFLASLAKLPETATNDYVKTIQDGETRAKVIIDSTGGTEALEEEAKSREIKRQVGIGTGAKLEPSVASDWLAVQLQKIIAGEGYVEKQAAETLAMFPELEDDFEMPLSALELQEKMVTRRLRLIQQSLKEAEERGIDTVSERGWWNAALLPRDFLGMVIPGFSTAPLSGNVPGLEENFLDNILPGVQQRREAEYLMDPTQVDDDEFDRLAPEVVKRTFDKTVQPITFGLLGEDEVFYQNKLYQEMVLNNFIDPVSALETNAFAIADYAGLLYPMAKMGVRGLSSIDMLKGVRANELLNSLTAQIMKKAENTGLERAVDEINTTVDDVESIVLPKAIDPTNSTVQGVSRTAAVTNELAEFEELARAAGVTNLDDLKRLRPEELRRAVAQTIKEVEVRTGRKIKAADVQEYNSTPGTGIYTPALRIMFGTTKGTGYKKLIDLQKFADRVGLSGYEVKYVPRTLDGAKQPEFVPPPSATEGVPFQTARGSRYVFQNGKTIREKVEGPNAGLKLESSWTIFVDEETALKLLDDPSLVNKDIQFSTEPRVGLSPFEYWEDTKRYHVGNKITEVGTPTKATDDIPVSVGRDEGSGEYFLVFETGVVEKGFFDPLEVMRGSRIPLIGSLLEDAHWGLARFFAGGRLIENSDMFGRAVLGEARRNALIQILNKEFAPVFKALKKEERSLLNTIARVEDREQRWMDDVELEDHYFNKFGFGSDASKFIAAHTAFRRINDLDWFLRNASVYSELSSRGMRQIGMKDTAIGNYAARPGTVADVLKSNPTDDVFDIEQGRIVDWGELDKKQLSEEGYVLVKYLKTQKFGDDGHIAKTVLVKKEHLEDAPLSRVQLGYRPGGHRIYSDRVRFWVKGAQYGIQPSTGAKRLLDPLTLKGGLTRFELENYVNDLNRYVKEAEELLANNPNTTAPPTSKLYRTRQNNPQLPAVSEILEMVRTKRVSSDAPFEIVEDRKLPSTYNQSPESMPFVDTATNPVYDHMNDTGRLYYSHRSEEIMLDYAGNELPVLDIDETINQALHNITKTVSFNSYKVSKMERWVETFKSVLEVKPGMSLDQMFNAEFRGNLTANEEAIVNAARTQRSVTRRLLNWASPRERNLEKIWNHFLNGVEVRGGTTVEEKRQSVELAKRFGEILGGDNVPQFFKGWAFDFKLGFLNAGQVPLQLATTLNMMGMDTTKTLQAIDSYIVLRSYNPASDHKALRAFFNNNALAKAYTGFDDVDEYIAMADQMKLKGGFGIVNRTQAVLDQATEGNLFGITNGIRDNASRLREWTRVFFYESEKANKYVAWQLSWRQTRERYPDLPYTSQEFIEKVNARASTLTVGMDNASSAAWQKGWASLPTQFWTYPVRSFELYLGRELSMQEKIRFGVTQALMYGVAAPPLVGSVVGPVMDRINQDTGVPQMDENPLGATLQRGLVDTFLYYGTGADVLYGDRVQTGRFVADTLAEFWGQSRYGYTSPGEMAGGASVSIFFDAKDGFGLIGKAITMKFNHRVDSEEAWDVLASDASEVARVISTWNNASKAMAAHQAGMMWSRRRPNKDVYLMATDLNQAEAVFLALGINPADSLEVSAALGDAKKRKNIITNVVSSIKQIDYEMMVADRIVDQEERSKRLQQLAIRQNTLIDLTAPEYRQEVLDQLSRYDYLTSMSETAVRNWEDRKARDKVVRDINNKLNEGEE